MKFDESELKKRFGQTSYQTGKKLFESGRASKPVPVGIGVYSVTVEQGYMGTEVLLWTAEDGSIVTRTVGGRSLNRDPEVAALLSYHQSEGVGTDNITVRFVNDPLYQEHLVYGGREEELNTLAEKLVDEYIEDLNRFSSPYGILDSLDKAIDCCYRNRDYDTVALGRILELRAKKMYKTIRNTKPSELSRILNSSDRIFSRRWLAESRLSDSQIMVAFADLSDRRSLNSYDTAILSILSRKVDSEEYADSVTDDIGYYEMERIALRELRRGHRKVAVAVSNRFSKAEDFDDHLSEAGRLRQEIGLEDNEGVFIRAFINEPNEKRLLDLIANHPNTNLEVVFDVAWKGSQHSPAQMVFFARNGLEEKVAKFLSVNEDWILDNMDENSDILQLLGEILKDKEQYEASANLLVKVLEDCLGEKGNENQAVHIMNTLDSEYEQAESILLHYCRNLRNRHRDKALWALYGSGGHF